VDFLPTQDDDDVRTERLFNPLHWAVKTRDSYREHLAPPDAELHEIMSQHAGGVLLHVGCGNGWMLEELARHPWRLRMGTARKLKRLLKAHRRPSGGSSLLLRCSPYRLPVRDTTVNTALLINPFVELKDPQACLYELVRTLAPQGALICRSSAQHQERLAALLSACGFAYYRQGPWWVGRRMEQSSSTVRRQA
jgi:ubiquinone/menaquinone biosynthesis C-methylase UbiE